ncbi:MAG: YihY/virulence factor BrkB family protein [Deltaproteobacteria bacterium]|nr:YihY/virulence factor BrkB family protein [Deltaproteobacteria bacterium]MDH3928644.1 YihY/virulence factor BrkB family protein [Deltaproteobacteria bacterium]
MTKKNRVETVFRKNVWEVELSSLPWWKALLIRVLRVFYVVIRDLLEGQLTLRAMSLVYTTLLAMVPLLAVSFSVLKGFGVHNQIEPLLLNFLRPLGERGVEVTSRIIGFVDSVKAGILGSIGFALLIYTVISLIQKIERACNDTWHVNRSRPLSQKFSDYLSVILIGPVLVFSALGITASVMSTAVVQKMVAIKVFGSLMELATKLVPYLLVIAAFTFVYIFVPNTRVRFRSALTGGLVAGVLWETSGWAFASFVVKSAKYTAIYSGFAILIMFMIWLYLSWLIVLVGASVAYYHQHPESVTSYRRELRLSNRMQEKLALLVMFLVGNNYYDNLPALTLEEFAQSLNVPMEALEPIMEALEGYGLLSQTANEPPTYLPARPLDTAELKDVLDAVRGANEIVDLKPQSESAELAVDQLVDHIDQAMAGALRGSTLKDLALSKPAPVTLVSQSSQKVDPSSGEV